MMYPAFMHLNGDLNGAGPVVANRVREARKRRGWTMAELAKAAGTTQQNVSLIERGRQQPRPQTIDALARALECDRAWLFFVTSDQMPSRRRGGRSTADTQKAS